MILPWAFIATASIVLPWALFPQIAGDALSAVLAPKALWDACWPIALGGVLAVLLHRCRARLPRIPEGDVVVLAERLGPAVGRLGDGIARADMLLRQWPVAGVILVALVLGLTAALHIGM